MTAERDASRVWSDSERRLIGAVTSRNRKPRPLRVFLSGSKEGLWGHPISREQLEVSLGRAISAGIIEPSPQGWAETSEFSDALTAYFESEEFKEFARQWENSEDSECDLDYCDDDPEVHAWTEQVEKWIPDPDARVSIDPEEYRRALLIARIRFVLAAPLWVVGVPLLLALYLVLTVVAVVGYGLYLFGAWVVRGFRPAQPQSVDP